MAMKRKGSIDSQSGVVVHALDGRMFFLPNSTARQHQLSPRAAELYTAFRLLAMQDGATKVKGKKKGGSSGGPKYKMSPCKKLKKWLDTHSPNSGRWRAVSLAWGGRC